MAHRESSGDGSTTDIKNINTSQSSDIVKISVAEYENLINLKAKVKSTFEEVCNLHRKITGNEDVAWSGASRKAYDQNKAFIDMFMKDLPAVFDEIDIQTEKVISLLNDLFSGESDRVKEFEQYDD